MTHPFFSGTRRPRVFAHRGLAAVGEDVDGGVWENSAAAFAAAHASGAEYIETDCRVTADGDVVLLHDETMERLAGDKRPVDSIRTAELREIFADHGGLLTVEDALESFPENRFNIDVKTEAAVEPLGPVLVPHVDRVLLTSFSDGRRRRAISAVLRAGASGPPATSAGRATIARLRAASALGLPSSRILDGVDAVQIPERYGKLRVFVPSLIAAARRRGVEVHVWTVNDPEDMTRLVAAGADGIVTDRADLAVSTLL